MKTRKVRVGDRMVTWFPSPWDEEVPIRVEFKVVRKEGRLFCEGIKTNEFDDWLTEFNHLELIKL